jgi:hypothetical protein
MTASEPQMREKIVARQLDQIPGVTGHGLFDPRVIDTVLIGGET